MFLQNISKVNSVGRVSRVSMRAVINKVVRKLWKKLPDSVRLGAVRATQSKFTVSAAAVIVNEENKVLLLNHLLRPYSGWGLPGGFINSGEQPDTAIRREIVEETGLILRDLEMVSVRTIKSHVEIMFKATGTGAGEIKER